MKKSKIIILAICVLSLLTMGALFACGLREVEVPLPESIGGENDCEHNYVAQSTSEATCTERAHTVYVCTECNDKYIQYEGDYAPHTLSERHYKGSCVAYGYTEHYCTECGNVIDVEYDSEYGDHSYKSVNRHVNGTCKTLGYTIQKECSLCGDQIKVNDESYGKHNYKKTSHTAATCVSYDYDTYTCSVCGDKYSEYGTQMMDHEFEESATQGTDCRHVGSITKRCVNCGYTETNDTAVYGPHSYRKLDNNGSYHECAICHDRKEHVVITRSASETIHRSYCNVCGYVAAESEHNYPGTPEITLTATCTRNGKATYTCADCNQKYSIVIPAKHSFDFSSGVYSDATCTENGYCEYSCSDCNEKLRVYSDRVSKTDSSVGVVPILQLTLSEAYASCRVGDRLSLGQYPQSRVSDPLVVVALNTLAKTPFSSSGWSVYRYSSAVWNENFAWYIDVEYGNKKYRGVYFTDYRPTIATGARGKDFSYVDDNGYEKEKVYWFRFEDLSWTVLKKQESVGYVIADRIYDCMEYGALESWITSFSGCFSIEERAIISAYNVDIDSSFGFSEKGLYDVKKLKTITDYALSQGAYSPSDTAEGVWWTGDTKDNDCGVMRFGYGIDLAKGHSYEMVRRSDNLLSPATCVSYAAYHYYCSECGALSEEVFYDDEYGYALHEYEYTYSDDIHYYGCVVCGEILSSEGHDFEYHDDCNGLTHTQVCAKCGYYTQKEHTFADKATICSATSCGAAKIDYEKYWDVSVEQDGSLIAFLRKEKDVESDETVTVLSIMGKGDMKNYSSTVQPPYYSYRSQVERIAFGEQMTSIGAYAFYDFSSLKEVRISSSINQIGKYAFAYAVNLSDLYFDASNCGDFGINNGVFASAGKDSGSLTVHIGDGSIVKRIPSYFMYPSTDTLPLVSTWDLSNYGMDGVAYIGEYAFASVGINGSVSLDAVRTIGGHAFYNTRINYLYLGDELTAVGEYAFYNCASTVFYGEPVLTSIGAYAFYNCLNLTAVRLSGIQTVPTYAFYNTSITNVELPGLTTVESYAFYNCSKITANLPTTLVSVGAYAFYNSGFGSDLVLNQLTSVGDYAFYGCDNVRSVSLASLSSTGKYAFSECVNLTDFRSTLTTIREGTFAGDKNLYNVIYSDTLRAIETKAFSQCSRLSRLLLPSTVTAIGSNAFTGCFRLVEIDNRSALSIQSGAVSYGNVAAYAKRVYNGASADSLLAINANDFLVYDGTTIVDYRGTSTMISIPADYVVSPYAFYYSNGIKEVTIASGSVGRYAFYHVSTLTMVTINGATTVGAEAFSGCNALSEVHIGSSVLSVEANAFRNDDIWEMTVSASSLQSLLLPSGYFSDTHINKIIFTDATVETLADYTGTQEGGDAVYTLTEGATPHQEEPTQGTIGELTYRIALVDDDYILTLGGSGTVPGYVLTMLGSYGEKITTVVISHGVTGIANSAFYNGNTIRSITIPDTVSSIGDNAFYGCDAVTTLSYAAEELIYVGEKIFYNLGRNTDGVSVTIKNTVRVIPSRLFVPILSLSSVAPKITEMTIESGVEVLGNEAFRDLKWLQSLSVPESVVSMGRGVFRGMELTSITLPFMTETLSYYFGGEVSEALTELEILSGNTLCENAFAGLSIQKIILPGGITAIGNGAFLNCNELEQIGSTEGEAVFTALQSVGNRVFYGCSSLVTVRLSSPTAFTLGTGVFANCASLTTLELRKAVSIGRGSFLNCESLTSLTAIDGNIYIDSTGDNIFGIYVKNIGSASLVSITGRGDKYTILDSVSGLNVTMIEAGAVADQTDIVEVTLGTYLTTINEEAFCNCINLKKINAAACTTLSYIGTKAFYQCTALEDIELPDSVTYIYDSAFMGCTTLVSFRLPASVSTLGENVFASCRRMKEFTFGGTETLSTLPSGTFASCVLLGVTSKIVLPRGLETIGERAFEQCASLKTVDLPDTLTTIGSYAFSHCKVLSELVVPANVTTLGENALNGCVGLKTLELGNKITSLGMGAFSGCSSLESLTIPFIGAKRTPATGDTIYPFGYVFGTAAYNGSVRTEQTAYLGNNNYSVIYYLPQTLKEVTVLLSSRINDRNVISEGAFISCTNLTSVDISSTGATVIGKRAFSGCSSLTTILYPESELTEIAQEAFAYCLSLNTVLLPERVTELDKTSFYHTGYYNNQTNWKKNILYIEVKRGTGKVLYAVDASTTAGGACEVEEGTVYVLAKAFENTRFTSVTLPSTLERMGLGVLKGNVRIAELSTPFIGERISQNNYLAYIFGGELTEATIEKKKEINAKEDFIPASLVALRFTGSGEVPEGVCVSCRYLENVILSEGYTLISKDAFAFCAALATVTLPKSLRTIKEYAFECSEALNGIVVPTQVTAIGKGAFSTCTNMRYYSAPFVGNQGTVTENSYLGYVFWPSNRESLTASQQNDVVPTSLATVILTGGADSVPPNAFHGCANIRMVVLNETMVNIGSGAFVDIGGVNSITVYIIGTGSYSPNYRDSIQANYAKFSDADKIHVYFLTEFVGRMLSPTEEDNYYTNTLVNNDDTDDIDVTYSSSDEEIAIISDQSRGTVHYLTAGTVEITAVIRMRGFVISLSYTMTIS